MKLFHSQREYPIKWRHVRIFPKLMKKLITLRETCRSLRTLAFNLIILISVLFMLIILELLKIQIIIRCWMGFSLKKLKMHKILIKEYLWMLKKTLNKKNIMLKINLVTEIQNYSKNKTRNFLRYCKFKTQNLNLIKILKKMK